MSDDDPYRFRCAHSAYVCEAVRARVVELETAMNAPAVTDERNPSDDVLDAVSVGRTGNKDDGLFAPGDYADWILHDLSAAGFVVVRAPGLNHGDELTALDIDHAYATLGTINGEDYVKYVYQR